MNLHDIEHPDDELARQATKGYNSVQPQALFRRRPDDTQEPFEVQDYPNTTWYAVPRRTAQYWAARA